MGCYERTLGQCKCGNLVNLQDFKFWGECEECRLKLPIQSLQAGDVQNSDRLYNGGNYNSGEW